MLNLSLVETYSRKKKKKKNVGYTPDTENIYETRRFTRSIVIHS